MKLNSLLIGCIAVLLLGCKKEEVPAELEFSTVTDQSGFEYKTVKIGSQWWMVENLKTTKYADGTPIALIDPSVDSLWQQDSLGATVAYDERYGRLYNAHAVLNSKGIAPAGWKVPSDADWKILENYLGMSGTEVEKLTWRGTEIAAALFPKASEFWPSTCTTFGTNSCGFNALPSGIKSYDGTLNNTGDVAFWWTSSESNNELWYRSIDSKFKGIYRQSIQKQYGLSIRCVKI